MYKNILALDTSDAGHLVLRLSTPDENYDIVSEVRLESELISAIDSLLQKSTLEDIDKFILGQGPGSFMGLRLGFAVFRTWAWLYKKPITLVSSLELLARSFELTNDSYDICVPCVDAKMKKVFARVDSVDCDIFPHDLAKKLPSDKKIAIIGTGAEILKEYTQLDKIDFYPDFKITSESFEREFISQLENMELQKIEPNYLRLSAAETALLEKESKS